MMTKKLSTQIVNFMTPKTGVLVQRRGHMIHMVKMFSFFKKSCFLLSKMDILKL